MDIDPEARRQVYRKSETVVEREIAGETLLVPVRGRLAQLHKLFVLDQVGAFIWQRLDGEKDLGTILDELLESFEVDAEEALRDLVDYVSSLREADLLAADETPP